MYCLNISLGNKNFQPLVSQNNTMADVDTSEQIDCLNKHKGKKEQDKAGPERDMQEARQGLDEDKKRLVDPSLRLVRRLRNRSPPNRR